MDQFFSQLPPRVLAIGALLVGLALIILNDPPKTVCDAQLEVFREAQKRFLFGSTEKGVAKKPLFEQDAENCRRGNGPGSCYEFFDGLKRLVVDVENIPKSCEAEAGKLPQIHRGLWEGLELMVMLAWGEKPPLTYAQRNGWLGASDVALFCRLRQQAIEVYGGEVWTVFRSNIVKKLPGATDLAPEQVWQRSILSTSCDNYR